ncbi:MAG: FAD-dependent oxidoreductase [Sphingomonadaceae bacterium]|nr:FAD-dependent oxidoreductase [Sphingomonadaceae bacterium]MCP5382992.1 FAD-dependent oxidoreductase [Altererythrobacter sp.]MCP5393175.1 FAD-dependent oxidoreductase [Sphingomonadaceae bacterium]
MGDASPINWRDHVRVWREKEPSPLPSAAPRENATIVIAGTGPVGLAQAIDLGQRGHDVVVLGRFDFVPAGSKAICFSKRSLDILDRLGVGDTAVERGVVWNVGKVFWGDKSDPVYQFDMLPVKNQKMPGFINIQQYYLEDILLERIGELPNIDIRWGHDVVSVEKGEDCVTLGISTAAGSYEIRSDWLIACDGNKSTVRELLALDFDGRVFEDNFLIADIKMKGERPSERWFWFDPPFNPGQSALMHKQPDDVWRLDFQLGWNIDREACIRPENVDPLVRAMLGDDVDYEQEWYSVYTFQCRRMARFVHDRVLFAGDSAHLVSPFGARGCNGGFADIDNLGWKLDLVLRGQASATLLESYNEEAILTADENVLNSTRSTDFITPKSKMSAVFRDTVLELARQFPFARTLVNSGRLSTAVSYPNGRLNTPDCDDWCGRGIAPGSVALDAPLNDRWLLEQLEGHFMLLANGDPGFTLPGIGIIDISGAIGNDLLIDRYALSPGAAYLLRPDQYVTARWKRATRSQVSKALEHSMGGDLG